MRIVDVRAVQPVAPNSPPDWRTSLGQILVAVDTDRGLTGYGVGGGGLAGVHVVRTVLRDALVGRDPSDVAFLSDRLSASLLPVGRQGLSAMARSGVDLALWDLAGKAAGVPVARLLNPDVRLDRPIPTYATVWNDVPPEVADASGGVKLHLGRFDSAPHRGEPSDAGAADRDTPDAIARFAERVADAVHRARRAIGSDRLLAVDAWMQWTGPQTRAVIERVRTARLEWIEEPLPVDDLDAYSDLAATSPIPIAGGEHEFTARGFDELIARRVHHVLQPDVCWCGGLTDLVAIYARARQAGVRVCPHRGAEPWGLHAIAALDSDPLAESGRPWMTWVDGAPEIVAGTVRLSEAPGFGVTIDESNLPLGPDTLGSPPGRTAT